MYIILACSVGKTSIPWCGAAHSIDGRYFPVPQVFPKCGDGVRFVVTLSPVDGSEVQVLHEAEYEVADKPTRQRLHFYLDKISTGDKVDLLVYPRGQHDCDGALILEVQIWEKKAYKG